MNVYLAFTAGFGIGVPLGFMCSGGLVILRGIGVPVEDIATRYGISKRRVRELLADTASSSPTARLEPARAISAPALVRLVLTMTESGGTDSHGAEAL